MKKLILIGLICLICLICLPFVGYQNSSSKEIDYYEKIIGFDNTVGEQYRSKHDYVCDYCKKDASNLYEWIDLFGNYNEAHYGICTYICTYDSFCKCINNIKVSILNTFVK